ncbi:MAG: SurA N-terminal domain-containing protein [Candidatus Solibacter usitatus]|nr:SurA N-terminal domain-containing protein [Candidatus Solibacter usitatus]
MRVLLHTYLPAAFLAAAVGLTGCKSKPPADVAATVNGRPVSYAEVDKQFRFQFGTAPDKQGDKPSEEQTNYQKLELLRTLVDNEIMLQRAEKLNLMATEPEVDAKFNELKAPYTQEEWQKQLQARNMSVEDLKTQLRRDLSIQKLFNKEITSKIAINDKEVTDFYNANKASFHLAEPHVHLAQIVVTSKPDPNVRNLKRDKAKNDEQARKKVLNLEARARGGEDFAMLAQNFSEDPNSAPNGGDMGFIGESSLDKTNPELRKMVMALSPGQVSPAIRSDNEYRILKVMSKEPAGQRELNDPRVQQSIRDQLINRKDQLLRAVYYEVARNDARVMNFFAIKVSDNWGKK